MVKRDEFFRNCKSNNRELLESLDYWARPCNPHALVYVRLYVCISGYIAEHEQNMRYM